MKSRKYSGKPNKLSSLNPLVVRRVVGHSMLPVLPPRTLIIGWRRVRRLKPQHVVIVQHNGIEKVKRIDKILGDGSLYVTGDHQSGSTDSRHFGALEPEAVVARVVWPSTRPETNPY